MIGHSDLSLAAMPAFGLLGLGSPGLKSPTTTVLETARLISRVNVDSYIAPGRSLSTTLASCFGIAFRITASSHPHLLSLVNVFPLGHSNCHTRLSHGCRRRATVASESLHTGCGGCVAIVVMGGIELANLKTRTYQ